MDHKLLGMYVHMHWGYNYPYAARTWGVEDWTAYLSGLKALGYNLVQMWPMVDTMPMPLTPSDQAHLGKLRQVIDIAHEMGITVFIGAGANTMGNERAADYRFQDRPYFVTERRIDPGNQEEVSQLMEARTAFLEPLAEADGFWLLDSDPGGYPDSPVDGFVHLFGEHRTLLDGLRPGIKLLYWMWGGWTIMSVFPSPDWQDKQKMCWRETVESVITLDPAPWGILACWPDHFAVVEDLGQTPRTLYFAYNTIEYEPSFPWTDYDPQRIQAAFGKTPPRGYPIGAMGNAQSHCLQLPHTYLFQHFASGGMEEQVDLAGFGEDVLPGSGHLLAQAWGAMGGREPRELEAAIEALERVPLNPQRDRGRLSGLCLHQGDRLIQDLKLQIAAEIAMLKMKGQVQLGGKGDLTESWRELVQSVQRWWDRHEFQDRYLAGPFKDLLHPILGEIAATVEGYAPLARQLHDFEKGVGDRHTAFARLFATLQAMAQKHSGLFESFLTSEKC